MNDLMCLEGGFWPAITGLLVAALAGGCNPGESLVTLTTATVTTEDETTASSNATTIASTATDSTESDATDSQTTTTVDTQTTSESDTTDPVPFCGDGVINGMDETCEPPNQGGCRRDCTKCGDSVVQPEEVCDEGELENGMYGPSEAEKHCSEDCQGDAPYCGDAFVLSEYEECESALALECSDSCRWGARKIFTTSYLFTGDMKPVDNDDMFIQSTGREKASKWCEHLASKALLPGTFRPWLSIEGDPAIAQFEGSETNANTVPYENTNGDLVAESWLDLVKTCTDDCLKATVAYDESGSPAEGYVWTNTNTNGVWTDTFSCLKWTSNDNGVTGYKGDSARIDSGWTVVGLDPQEIKCDVPARLYCIQDGPKR